MTRDELIEAMALSMLKVSAINVMGTRDLEAEWLSMSDSDKAIYLAQADAALAVIEAHIGKAALTALLDGSGVVVPREATDA